MSVPSTEINPQYTEKEALVDYEPLVRLPVRQFSKLDQKTVLSTMITFKESMTRSFEDMKNIKATEVSPEYYERMDKLIKRPPLLSHHLNLSAKVFAIIMTLFLVLGAVGYVWRERSYIAHRDTLRQLLNDQSIFINRIQYENSERLIDYTDSTSIIKAAHFRKDESIRITDSPEVITLHDARTMRKVWWRKIREEIPGV